ncbi:hypothetical protein E1B28_011633 [Marasmius oreades]|uniref:Uncharacterized protein n=1 Tax=Marasmius oreades TaxID=181124 RepID=A0A9P7RUQ1_9AGAR|nr:uncharacterized protein E1B28_011633 [Marasmius oreades]KAG7090012.1 hypothetical protein E1B28_011633 [Marasmius oreades]
MTSRLLGTAGKKLFERNLEQYTPADPLYEEYTDDRGRKKRKRRAIPPGLSSRDAKILKSVQKRAHYLDKGFSLCGFRFGWTFVVGIIPGAGDIADATLNYVLVIRKAKQADIPSWLLSRMLFHNAVSAGVGLVPFVGDVVLAIYKANSRNAALLEEFLRVRGEEFLKLSEEGMGPQAVVAANTGESSGATNGSKGKGFWKGKSKNQQVAEGVTKADVEQVKPGSGMKTTTSGGTSTDPGASRRSSSRKGFTSLFGNKDKTPAVRPVSEERGRFVENVDVTKKA